MLAFVSYVRYDRTGGAAAGSVGFLFPKSVYAHPSARVDYQRFLAKRLTSVDLANFSTQSLTADDDGAGDAAGFSPRFEEYGNMFPNYGDTAVELVSMGFHHISCPFVWETVYIQRGPRTAACLVGFAHHLMFFLPPPQPLATD